MTPETILALMLVTFAPGKSIYSQAEVDEHAPLVALRNVDLGDGRSALAYELTPVGEEDPAQCLQPTNVACRRPHRDDELGGWFRVERFGEGLERYWTIAQELAAACPTTEDARFALTVTFHESGWRRDVHAGYNHRPYRLATVQEDHGKSWCLGQIMVAKKPTAKVAGTEYRARDLVGVSAEATARCLAITEKNVARSIRYCRYHGGGGDACVFATYGGGGNIPAKAMRSRTRMVQKLRDLGEPELTDVIRDRLGLAPKNTEPAS